MHCLQSWHNKFFVKPPQKVIERAHLFLLPCLLQVMIILNPTGVALIVSIWWRLVLWSSHFSNGQYSVFDFESVFGFTAAKFIVESIIRRKFCILFFVGVIKWLVGDESLCLWSFVCLQDGIKTCWASKKNHNIQQLYITDFNEINWFAFFIPVGSVFRSLTRMGTK